MVHHARKKDETSAYMSLMAGQLVSVTAMEDGWAFGEDLGWAFGEDLVTGERGWFPPSFVTSW